MANIVLADDGTLDTVIECLECGDQFRFTYDHWSNGLEDDSSPVDEYDVFVDECIAEIEAEHVCETCPDCDCADPTAPVWAASECDCDCHAS